MSNKNEKYRRVHFAITAIEGSAKRLNIPGNKMYSRLEKQNLINERLFKYYELLHTQSLDWVIDDTIETLTNWERESRINTTKASVNKQSNSHRQYKNS